MSTIDEILAAGWYTDRRGRGWDYVETVASWCSPEIDGEGVSWGYRYLDTAQMRLLIERDQHVCQGLRRCFDHPVPHVLIAEWDHDRFGGFMVYPAGDELVAGECDFHDEAMDAARALAVGA